VSTPFRVLRQSPWYAAAIVSVLAVGIALTTVTFAVVDGVLFKPLPFNRSHDLHLLHADTVASPRREPPAVSSHHIAAWREAAPDLVFTVVAHDPRFGEATIDERFFDVMGIRPIAGGFTADDFGWLEASETSGKRIRPLLIPYRRWVDEYGADPAVVGRTFITADRPGFTAGYRIAGVLPPDFVFPIDLGGRPATDVGPLRRFEPSDPVRSFHVVARVASKSASGIADRLTVATRERPEPRPQGHVPAEVRQYASFDRVRLVPLDDHLARHVRPAFGLVFAGAALLLLLACVNVAGLVAARNVQRHRDIAIRRALGASTGRLLLDLSVEVLILATIAMGVALLLTRPLLLWTLALLPPSVPLLKQPAVDARVIVAASLVALLAALLVSLWPGRVAARVGVVEALGRGTSGATGRSRRTSLPLVTAQVGLGFVLLTAGALTVASLARAWRNDTGFHRDRLILLETYVARAASSQGITENLTGIPPLLESVDGVSAVAISSIGPLFARRGTPWSAVVPDGWKGKAEGIQSRLVSANFFDVMGLRLIDGVLPVRGEWPAFAGAVVSERAARLLWPGQSPLGRILVNASGRVRGQRIPVIAVVADTRFAALDEAPYGDIYLPEPIGRGVYGVYFHVRTTREAADVLPHVQAALSGRGLFFEQAWTHEDALFASVRHRALPAWLFGSLGLGALVVVGAGILGLLAMTAAQRTREIGIRIALGATRTRVVRMMFREQFVAVTFGLVAGALVSAWTVRYLESQLYAVAAYDLGAWSLAALLLIGMAAAGTLVPSLRAARTNPVIALRAE
jgi:predicted permease